MHNALVSWHIAHSRDQLFTAKMATHRSSATHIDCHTGATGLLQVGYMDS